MNTTPAGSSRDTGNAPSSTLTAATAASANASVPIHTSGASLVPPLKKAAEKATNTCWLDVVNDWLDHSGVIHGTYPIPCYTQAIQHLDSYPDIKEYSTASDDIHRALLAALRQDRGGGPGNGGLGGGTNPRRRNTRPGRED